MSKAAVDAHNYLTASGDAAVRLRRNGGAVGLPAHAEDLPEPTLREMFLANRQWKNDLRRRAKKGEPVGDQLSLARRRAKWIKHMLRESYPNARVQAPERSDGRLQRAVSRRR